MLAKKYRAFTVTPPILCRQVLTCMPMSSKAFITAWCQTMIDALGQASYKYALVWANSIIIYNKNVDNHSRHVEDIHMTITAI